MVCFKKKKPARTEPAVEEDKELEKLRLEALNAKRASLEAKPKGNNKRPLKSWFRVLNQYLIDRLPGRFRYQRDSEEENDDEYEVDDYAALPSVSIDDDEDQHNQTRAYKSNYEVYKRECSKLMAHDAYEPSSEPGTSELNHLRLKNLRERVEHKLNNGTTEPYDPVGDQDHIDLEYVPMRKDSLVRLQNKTTSRKNSNRSESVNEYYSSSSDEDGPTVNKKLRSVIVVPASRPATNDISNDSPGSKQSRSRRSRSRSRQRNRSARS